MRHNRNSFYDELTPLADKLAEIRLGTRLPQPARKDHQACLPKREAKLARRAAAAKHQVKS